MVNLLIVDSKLPSLSTFVNGVNENTKVISYSVTDTFNLLKEKISNLQVSNFDNLGFVFMDDGGKCLVKKFVSDSKFLNIDEINGTIQENNTTKFIKEIVQEYLVKNLDFLTCNLLSYDEWKNYFDYLMKENQGLIVRASNDKTGNLSVGGDWILESTNEDVSNLYFNNNISNWNELLDVSLNIVLLKMNRTPYLSTGGNFTEISGFSNNVLYTARNGDFIIKLDGTVWCRGDNTYGQLGVGDKVNKINYTQAKDNTNSFITNAVSIEAGSIFTVILRSDKTIWVAGEGQYSGLGAGVTTNLFTQVSGINDVRVISCGLLHTMIIRDIDDCTVWGVGYNEYGQLGVNNYNAFIYTFTKSQGVNGTGPSVGNGNYYVDQVSYISCGNYHTAVLKTSGYVYTSGYNYYGQLSVGVSGYGNNNFKRNIFQNTNGSTFTNSNVISIDCGSDYTTVLKSNNTFWMAGITGSTYLTQKASNIIGMKCAGSLTTIINSDNTVKISTNSAGGTFANSNLTSAVCQISPIKWYYSQGFDIFNNNDAWLYYPKAVNNTVYVTASDVTNNNTSFFYNYSDKKRSIKLEPAGAVFNTHVYFDVGLDLTNSTIVYFKSDSDTTHVRLTTNSNSSYGAYYQENALGDGSSIRIYTKHFSEVGFGFGAFCLLKGTKVLTPDGYKLIETLKFNDIVITDDNRKVPIKMIFKTIIDAEKKPDFIPYKIEKNSIAENYPLEDTYMSGYHMIKYANNWIEPIKCPKFSRDLSIKEILYYHIQLENYETDNLVVNGGLVVESLGDGTDKDGKIWVNRTENSLIIE